MPNNIEMGIPILTDDNLDPDIYDNDVIHKLFLQTDPLIDKTISEDRYILSIDASCENEPSVAVTLSENGCEIYKLSNQQISKLTNLTDSNYVIFDCKFSKRDSNIMYTGSANGSIAMWDLRIPKKYVNKFLDTTSATVTKKKINCFDSSPSERLLSAGTQLFEGDAFLLFWDIRSYKLLGGYWESHSDDITQVKFHLEDNHKLLSGSTDGLINVYDLLQTCEEDALIESLNVQSSVESLIWYNENKNNNISCVTHSSDLLLWNTNNSGPYKHFTRADVAKGLMKQNEEFVYIANVHDAAHNMLLLAGSNYGKGECLRGLKIKYGEIESAFGFYSNKQRVRSSWLNSYTNLLLTGGDKGILDVWRLTMAA